MWCVGCHSRRPEVLEGASIFSCQQSTNVHTLHCLDHALNHPDGPMLAKIILLGLTTCGTALSMSGIRLQVRRNTALRTFNAPSLCATEPTPEEMLLEAVGFMREDQIVKARSSLSAAQKACKANGGPTAEQSALINMLAARLVPPKEKERSPSLADMYPGTSAAPTGESLILPGTPSMAELAAKAKEKQQAAAEAEAKRRRGSEGGASMMMACEAPTLSAPSSTTLPAPVSPLSESLVQLCRRQVLAASLSATAAALPAMAIGASGDVTEWQDPRWATLGLDGTSVPLRSIESAAAAGTIGQMALYPDPLLRVVGRPVTSFGPAVEAVASLLVRDMKSNAITALQYGVDARMIALKGPASPTTAPLVFVNPTILSRSSEAKMVPWREICLVLPPGLEVDLLRDEVVEVAAQDVFGVPFRKALRGEAARAFQHELDHLDGILIVDHAGLDELPPGIARLEKPYHAERQRRAFARRVYQGETLYY